MNYSNENLSYYPTNMNNMFGLFKKKSEVEKLREQYSKLMKEAFDLSKVDRTKSDQKTAEADELMKKIEALSANNS